jgi:hypothetical protein
VVIAQNNAQPEVVSGRYLGTSNGNGVVLKLAPIFKVIS